MVKSIERLIAEAGADATRTCRQCRRPVPVKLFASPRHRICQPCHLRHQARVLEYELGQAGVDPDVPVERTKGVTTTPEGRRKYMRDYMRRRSGTNDREPPLRPPKTKFCMVCRHYKLTRDFANYHVRTCLRCDGTPLVEPR